MTISQGEGDQAELNQLVTHHQRGTALAQALLSFIQASDQRVAELLLRNRQLEDRIHELERLALTDPLTGLSNRRALEEAMEREEARARRMNTNVAVVLMDVDGLKMVNTEHALAGGDTLLRAMADALRSTTRGSDVIARLGGDEFAAILPGTDHAGAQQFVERVRAAVPGVKMPRGAVVPLRFSAGAASREETGSLRQAVDAADERLREAKHAARRTVPG